MGFMSFFLSRITLCPFLFCNHLEEEEKAEYLAIIALQMYCYYKCYVAFLTVHWVGLACVIMVFLDHTHFSMHRNINKCVTNMFLKQVAVNSFYLYRTGIASTGVVVWNLQIKAIEMWASQNTV